MDVQENNNHQTIATIAILSVLTLERLAFYALASTFYLFLNEVSLYIYFYYIF